MDELYTIMFPDEPEKGEKIPGRNNPAGDETINKNNTNNININNINANRNDEQNQNDKTEKPDTGNKSEVEFYTITLQEEPVEKNLKISGLKNPARSNTSNQPPQSIKPEQPEQPVQKYVPQERGFLPAKVTTDNLRADWNTNKKVRTMDDFYAKYGKPPSLTTASISARQGSLQLLNRDQTTKKSFFEMAREYADKTHEKTEHIPFMCYWPSYEYMSEPQLNWYLYLRECLKNGEYPNTDLSYLFVYIYEIINQIGLNKSDDGFDKMVEIWKNYRKTHDKLDRYLIDWTSDYIRFYNYNASKAFELLEKEDLFLLMPADMLMEHYIKSDMALPLEVIARFSDYKFYESEFIKSSDGNLFTDHLPGVFNKIRKHMNEKKEGDFETRFTPSQIKRILKIPFLRAPFDNKTNVRLPGYLPYEQHKPLRAFITTVVKEFENQLRALTKHKGRLRPEKLPDEIINICKTYAQNAVNGAQPEQTVEIKIDRKRLLALIQDSDIVRKKLIEGNYEYGDAPESAAQTVQNDITNETNVKEESQAEVQEPVADEIVMLESGNKLLPDLSPVQQKIVDYLMEHGGGCKSGEIGAAFQGVFVGVEIDKINDYALETIGDLLIGFEDEQWYIMEDYIDDL